MITILVVCVDDNILIGDNLEEMVKLKGFLVGEFEIKYLSPLKYFIGMEVV